jgi:hypothetical protein
MDDLTELFLAYFRQIGRVLLHCAPQYRFSLVIAAVSGT